MQRRIDQQAFTVRVETDDERAIHDLSGKERSLKRHYHKVTPRLVGRVANTMVVRPVFPSNAVAARMMKLLSAFHVRTSPGFVASRVMAPVLRSTRYMSKTFRSRRFIATKADPGCRESISTFCARTPRNDVRSRPLPVVRSTEKRCGTSSPALS